ncbi:MAG: glycosyltransferase family 2 protein, partial [Candidatus Binatia bacterium]
MPPTPDESTGGLSVLVVNYNTTALTRRCVASLHAQKLSFFDGVRSRIEVIVVDNASRTEEQAALAGINATIVYSNDNHGYGAALNHALKVANGEYILFSNSDTWYFPNALQALLDWFRQLPRCGAVGPRLWWDYDRAFLLPPSDPVTPMRYIRDAAVRANLWWHQQSERHWRQQALRYWKVQEPLVQPMLSGACILTHKNVLTACGGFDELFRLYYEDTDWCRRVRQKGYRLYYIPEADVAHFYNQSGRQDVMEVQRIGRESEARYFQKHYGVWSWNALSWVAMKLEACDTQAERINDYVDLGICGTSPEFWFSPKGTTTYLWQLSQ